LEGEEEEDRLERKKAKRKDRKRVDDLEDARSLMRH
jgi:hypothetical protein